MSELHDRVAIVTGGADGIGAGIVRALHRAGARVVVADIDIDKASTLAGELGDGAVAVETNAADPDSCRAMVDAAVETFGTVDILVNNAWGGGQMGRFENKSDDLLQHGFDMAVRGPVAAMNAVRPIMADKGWGRIINMASLNGVNAHMGTAEYNIGKEGLRAATRTAAREWAPTGITCNIICPAAKSAAFMSVMEGQPEMIALADASNPMGRIGDPEDDIAPVALFLASEASRYMTGNTLFVDGGSHINGSPWAPDLDG